MSIYYASFSKVSESQLAEHALYVGQDIDEAQKKAQRASEDPDCRRAVVKEFGVGVILYLKGPAETTAG